jgi:PPK2 family polyphosphate:nucleotide phosphotransferase
MASSASARDFRGLLRVTRRLKLTSRLADATPGAEDESAVERDHKDRLEKLSELQHKLYADGRHGVLVVLQGMDACGKDGTIRKVFTGFNPQGCRVTSFKAPSSEEAKHDYLWRAHANVPPRGIVGVFNRSHYEEVLIVRVDGLVPRNVWRQRYDQINAFEAMLVSERIHVLKFMLHISKDEQLRRFKSRMEKPHKRWKFEPDDLEKRKKWNAYQRAYGDALARCSTDVAPWYVIPANHKWYRDYAIARILSETLQGLPLRWPEPRFDPARIRLR